ncbi:PilX N-terminal domain-containing pilus assembly protein [Dehalobacter sp. DCM]|uniref:pilus assembly PilX N-terminal domain-containing protein n=1 Tax=Dehalobacter sp. DCM TaxID=2907827 RepID=UPI003081E2E6|nr:PilX N-terminal domain-containing pilus assembly protein [Dehalobacter sp. DCM]
MRRKLIQSDKGITMVMVIMVTAILSILGIAILTLTVSNLKVMASDKNVKNTFYIADSAVDQAYGLLSEQVKAAAKAGNEAINIEVDTIIADERVKLLTDETYVSPWLNADGSLKEDYLIQQVTDPSADYYDEFLDLFKTAFAGNMNGNTVAKLTDTTNNNYKPVQGEIPEAVTVNGAITSFNPADGSGTLSIPLTFTVRKTINGQDITQQISSTFTVDAPDRIIGYQTESSIALLHDQPLWRTALASYKDITFSGSAADITVKGDIFACGTKQGDLSDMRNFGGITAGADATDNTHVYVYGDAYSYANLQVNADNSGIFVKQNPLTATGGNSYIDNLVVQQGTTAGTVQVDNNVYAKDDIEMNGTNAMVSIGKDYYGYSMGLSGVDMSSSIIINSEDIDQEEGSSLQILGNTFLAGSSYIDDPTPYQTGESVSVVGNYRSYGYLEPGDLDKYSFRQVGDSMLLMDKNLNTDGTVSSDVTADDKALRIVDIYTRFLNFLNIGYNDPVAEGQPVVTNSASAINLQGSVRAVGAFIKNGIQWVPFNLNDVADRQSYENHWTAVLNQFTNDFSNRVNTAMLYDGSSWIRNNEIDSTGSIKEVSCIQNQDIYILGPEYTAADVPAGSIVVTAPGSPSMLFGGLILTSGKVYVLGTVTFYGSVIAGDNIVVKDQYAKNFIGNENLVKHVVAAEGLDDLFKSPTGDTDPFNYAGGGGAPDELSANPYQSLIKVQNWQRM